MDGLDGRPGVLAENRNGDQLLTGVNVQENNCVNFLL